MTTNNDLGYDHILWLDLETTGADREKDCILEVGWVLTDVDLVVITCGSDLVEPRFENWMERIGSNKVVLDMHDENGLIVAMDVALAHPSALVHSELVAELILETIQEKGAKRRRTILAGSGVSHFDRDFLRTEMPALLDFLSYPQLDVGQFRRFMRQAGLDDVVHSRPTAPDSKAHRGLDDALDHLEEARFFIDWLRKANHG